MQNEWWWWGGAYLKVWYVSEELNAGPQQLEHDRQLPLTGCSKPSSDRTENQKQDVDLVGVVAQRVQCDYVSENRFDLCQYKFPGKQVRRHAYERMLTSVPY